MGYIESTIGTFGKLAIRIIILNYTSEWWKRFFFFFKYVPIIFNCGNLTFLRIYILGEKKKFHFLLFYHFFFHSVLIDVNNHFILFKKKKINKLNLNFDNLI